MTSAIRLNHLTKEILISKSFAKVAMNPNSTEYKDLAEVMTTHPDYKVTQRVIKKNDNKKSYKGLTYDYMRNYILNCNAPIRKRYIILADFEELLLISKCQSKSLRYPVIKHWFLEKFPEIEKFGLELKESAKDEEAQDEIVDDEVLEEIDDDTAEEELDKQPEKKSA